MEVISVKVKSTILKDIDWNSFLINLQQEFTKEWRKLLEKQSQEIINGKSDIINPKGLINGQV